MKRYFAYLVLFLATTSTWANDIDHDAKACPDLTGVYLLPDPVFEPMTFHMKSLFDTNQAPRLTIRIDDQEDQDVIELDGVMKVVDSDNSFMAACQNQVVHVLEYQGKSKIRHSTFELDGDKNLQIIIDEKNAEKIRQIGIRQ